MKFKKILIAAVILVFLACNVYLIYQNTQQKIIVDDLRVKVVDLQKQTKSLNNNVNNVYSEIQNIDSDVRDVCDSLQNCW